MNEKPCYQFDFGKGVYRYGAKCKFSHNRNGGGVDKGGSRKFTSNHKKTVSTMVASSMKKIFKEAANKRGKKRKMAELGDSDEDQNLTALIASLMLSPVSNSIPRIPANRTLLAMKAQLHDVGKTAGADTDGAVSCSKIRGDFPLWLDTSDEANRSVPAPSGVGGGGLHVGGIGPLIVRAETGEFFLDPEGVFLVGEGPDFRILAVQRFKAFGVRLVGCFNDTEVDVWQDRRSGHVVQLTEGGPPI